MQKFAEKNMENLTKNWNNNSKQAHQMFLEIQQLLISFAEPCRTCTSML